jgi:hypothetical protein
VSTDLFPFNKCNKTQNHNFFVSAAPRTKAAESMPPVAAAERVAESPAGMLDQRFELLPLSVQERDAATSMVRSSRHTKLSVLPNHCMNIEGELEGFAFKCASDDPASVLPLTKTSMFTTAVYECDQDHGESYLRLTSDISGTTRALAELMCSIDADHASEPLNLDCMPDLDFAALSQHTFRDQRTWRENIPAKVGVYHCFMRASAQNMREHKIFIVVSGCCTQASEELYNMWLDAREHITAGQFLACAEIDWLRKATLRHHNRLAARVAQRLKLPVRLIDDINSVESASMLLPTTSCVTRDITTSRGGVLLTSDAVVLDRCKSGVFFDCNANEGFWVFTGPRDTSSYRMFGTEFKVTGPDQCFPTRSVRYHRLYASRDKSNIVAPYGRDVTSFGASGSGARTFSLSGGAAGGILDHGQMLEHVFYQNASSDITGFLFPHSNFLDVLSSLGFNPNDGIVNLMPIAAFCNDE